MNVAQICRGCIGLAKAALHIDRASEATILLRRDYCRNCDKATRSKDPKFSRFNGLTSLSRCTGCGCNIMAKTVIKHEVCPLGRWP